MTKDEQITRLVLDRKKLIEELAIMSNIKQDTIVGYATKQGSNVYGKTLPNLAAGFIRDSYDTIINIYNDQIETITKQIDNLLNP